MTQNSLSQPDVQADAAYRQAFLEAVERTRRYGLRVPTILEVCPTPPHLAQSVPSLLSSCAQVQTPDDLAGKCVRVNLALYPALQKRYGAAYLTIGYYDEAGTPFFQFSEQNIEAWLRDGIGTSTAQFHVWITLPDMQILDVTLGTSISKYRKVPAAEGAIICDLAERLSPQLVYHPMVVGEDFLYQIGAVRQVLYEITDPSS